MTERVVVERFGCGWTIQGEMRPGETPADVKERYGCHLAEQRLKRQRIEEYVDQLRRMERLERLGRPKKLEPLEELVREVDDGEELMGGYKQEIMDEEKRQQEVMEKEDWPRCVRCKNPIEFELVHMDEEGEPVTDVSLCAYCDNLANKEK